ncbi:MAG: DUF3568 family protein [Candidatus Omnitrophica bacterium]|nr:DUF3568 family protein [Candidatus Omnitrophota bacterium]MDE2009221.1 DUF3568 family protein [Candidatus Omnitrophota bacterium]MDE2213742.1 DUF3568 family protein [Candidatus Omnitrophota bacterium]MDE2230683.1 DUF3568 family protein [Candidatus Omnitrophota bacterium]
MNKRIVYVLLVGMLTMNLCGCFALFAGVVGGAGTAIWLSGKLSQDFHASYHDTINGVKAALRSLNLPLVKEVNETNVTQLKSTYTDGREIWIDIRRVSEKESSVQVRVGMAPDKQADSVVLKRIQHYL